MAGRAALVAAALCASALCAAGEGELRGGRDTGFDGPRLELRVEAMLNDAWTPVSVNLRRTPHKVGLCKLDHELRHQDPSAVPMFQEWSRRSGCTGGAVQHVPLVVYEKVVGSIVDRYEKTGTADEGFPPPVPNGIIYHMMRTGSTLWGNMLSRAENVLVYSEPFTIIDAVSGSGLPPDRRAQLLKLLYAGMTRVRGHSSSVLKFPIAATVQVYENMHMAFPGTPWVYIFRRPEEVLASMFRVAGQNPRLRGKKADSKRPPNAPCTRTKGPGAPAPVKTLLREGSGHSPQESSHDEYCAAFLAMLCDSAITWHKQALEAPKEEHPPGMFLNYVSIPHVILAVSRQHFGIPLTEEQARKVAEEGGVYSKSRAKPGKGGQAFKGDAEDKMAQSPDSYHLWSSVYLYERYAAMTALAQGVELLDTAQQEQLKAEVEWVTSARETWSAKLAKGGSVGQGGGRRARWGWLSQRNTCIAAAQATHPWRGLAQVHRAAADGLAHGDAVASGRGRRQAEGQSPPPPEATEQYESVRVALGGGFMEAERPPEEPAEGGAAPSAAPGSGDVTREGGCHTPSWSSSPSASPPRKAP